MAEITITLDDFTSEIIRQKAKFFGSAAAVVRCAIGEMLLGEMITGDFPLGPDVDDLVDQFADATPRGEELAEAVGLLRTEYRLAVDEQYGFHLRPATRYKQKGHFIIVRPATK